MIRYATLTERVFARAAGGLFTRDWLTEGIRESAARRALDESPVAGAREVVGGLLSDLLRLRAPVEAETEDKLVYPVLLALAGSMCPSSSGRMLAAATTCPNALLFHDAEADEAAAGLEPWQLFHHGSAQGEGKRWNRFPDGAAQSDLGVPAAQLMHFLSRAEVISQGRMRWGILSNGRQWRLYWQGAH